MQQLVKPIKSQHKKAYFVFLFETCLRKFRNSLNGMGVFSRMSGSVEYVEVIQSFLKDYSMAMVLNEILKN